MSDYPKELAMKGYRFILTPQDHVLDGELYVEYYKESLKRFPWFFIEQFQKVTDPGGSKIPAKLNRPQQYIEWCTYNQLKYYNYVHMWVLKPRQIGSSWYWGRHGEHHAIWYNHLCKIMAHAKDQTALKSLFKYVMDGYEDLVDASEQYTWLKPYLQTSKCSKTGGILEFSGNSTGTVEVVNSEISAVGFACQHAHISEIPLIENFNEFWNQFSRSLHKAFYHVFVGESSAHHTDNLFLDIFDEQVEQWRKLKNRPPSLRPVFIPPYMHDEYKYYPVPSWYNWDVFWAERDNDKYGDEKALIEQKWLDPFTGVDEKGNAIQELVELPLSFWKWRRDQIDDVKSFDSGGLSGLDYFKEQFPMTYKEARISMGDSVFNRTDVDYHKKRVLPPIKDKCGDIVVNEETKKPEVLPNVKPVIYRAWDEPRRNVEYFIGCDPANERKGDSTVAIVYSPKQDAFVACFEMNTADSHCIAEHLIATALYWNNALIGYEDNLIAVGDSILKKLTGKDMANPVGAPYYNIYWQHTQNTIYNKASEFRKYGITTSSKQKGLYVQLTRDFIARRSSDIWIPEYLNQVWHVEQRANREGIFSKAPAAPRGRHDDYWIAGAIALFIARDCYQRRNLQEQMKENSPDDKIRNYQKNYKKRVAELRRASKPVDYREENRKAAMEYQESNRQSAMEYRR